MSKNFTYADLVDRLGEVLANWFLTEIERAAGIKPQYQNPDPEARLAHACWLQDNAALELKAA